MENDKFHLLISVLDGLEEEYLNKSKLGDAILRIIDKFDGNLTIEQKEQLLRDFNNYEKIKAERELLIDESEKL